MAQHPRPVGPTGVNAAATFTSSMSQGSRPERSPIRAAWRPTTRYMGWQVAQTTHVQAPYIPAMGQGWHPDRNREFLARNAQGWQANLLTFAVVMTPEMFAGSHPDRSRAWLAPRIPLPLSQTTHVPAAFSVNMSQGSVPDRARPHVLGKLGWQTSQTTFAVEMTPEMFGGWHPDTSRAWIAPRIPLPFSQTTHDEADFSVEMSQGQHPDQPRLPFRGPVGWQVSQTTHVAAAFSLDMSQGHHPDQRRLHVLGNAGWQTSQPTFAVQITQDMLAGWHPDRSRAWLAPKIPLPVSQTTHVAAAFSVEMSQGQLPALKWHPPPRLQIWPWFLPEVAEAHGASAARPANTEAVFVAAFNANSDAVFSLALPANTDTYFTVTVPANSDAGTLALFSANTDAV